MKYEKLILLLLILVVCTPNVFSIGNFEIKNSSNDNVLTVDNQGNLVNKGNTNSSNFFGFLNFSWIQNVPSYVLVTDLIWTNITGRPTHLSNFTDNLDYSTKSVNYSQYTNITNLQSLNYSNQILSINNTFWNQDVITKEPTGMIDRTTSTITFDNSTREFKLVGTYDIYINGTKHTKTNDSVIIPNVTGLNFIYYLDGTMIQSVNSWGFKSTAQISTVYWNAQLQQGLVSDERHGLTMDWITHEYLHETIGARYYNGMTGTFTNTAFSITAGEWYDEDLEFKPDASTTCNVVWRSGSNTSFLKNQTQYYYKNATNMYYDNNGVLSAVGSNNYMAIWFYVTNDKDNPIYCIVGQRTDGTIGNALTNNVPSSVSFGNLPVPEMKALYRVIVRNDGTPYEATGTVDYRTVSQVASGNYVATSHSTLTGLNADDHPQYLLADGSRTLTGNWNTDVFNITSSNFFGFLNFSWIQEVPLFALISSIPTHLSNLTDNLDYSTKNVNSSVYWGNLNSVSELDNTHLHDWNNLTNIPLILNGTDGVNGTDGLNGSIWRGEWEAKTYYFNDVVGYLNSSYICGEISSCSSGVAPDPESIGGGGWYIVAMKGSNGIDGTGFNWKGAWYDYPFAKNDVVSYLGDTIICVVEVCAAGSEPDPGSWNLYTSQGDNGTSFDVSGDYLYNNGSNVIFFNDTKLDDKFSLYALLTDIVSYVGNWSADKNDYTTTVNLPDSHTHAWTNLTDYPVACPSNNFMTQVGDTITCTSVQEIPLSLQIDNNLTVDGLINGNSTWQHQSYPSACPAGSAVTTIGDATTCSDSWVNIDGDTMTGNLNMSNNNITDISVVCLDTGCTSYITTNASGMILVG